MDWKDYFQKKEGTGFLATAGAKGEVNIAVYSRPHVHEDGTFVFGMADRLTHANLEQNPQAVYAFHEGHYEGYRIYLEKVREEKTGPMIDSIRDRAKAVSSPGAADMVKYAVYFRVA
ncbi:MAG: pyridoxamine 5'-phosphate oxidase family protein, partial [Proteobacteria bacterium]|nr:pyridoxamine 5'-phosphate oxidase family protein [Pseudomonadota bacterium]